MALMTLARRLPQWMTLSACVLSAVACGKQAEGDRCDLRNANSDCESGLECTPLDDLIGRDLNNSGAGLCCPVAGQASVSACIPDDTSFGDTDGGGIPDAAVNASGGSGGTPDAGTPDGSQ